MRNINVSLELEKIFPVNSGSGKDYKEEVGRLVEEMLVKDKSKNSYLSNFKLEKMDIEEIKDPLLFTLVKKAIDAFDPYFVHPDSFDEYDGESRRIASKIEIGMSTIQIAEIMKKEFNYSFSADFSTENFHSVAEKVLTLLKDCLVEPDKGKIEITSKNLVYVKLRLSKLIIVESTEKEDSVIKAIDIVFKEIEKEEKAKTFLSTFFIDVGWGTGDRGLLG